MSVEQRGADPLELRGILADGVDQEGWHFRAEANHANRVKGFRLQVLPLQQRDPEG